MVANGGYSDIYLNTEFQAIPEFRVAGSQKRADIVGIRRASGGSTIDVCEVLSIGQDASGPLTSALSGMATLINPSLRGSINIFSDNGASIVKTA
jgi:hypothetical protein